MHFAPPALLAATLAATLIPAQGQAPTSNPPGRNAAGAVVDTIEAAADEAYLVAAAPPDPQEVLSDAAPLPEERQAPARSRGTRANAAVHVAQAAPAERPRREPAAAPRASSAPPAATNSGSLARPCSSVTVEPTTTLTLGKSQVVRLPFPVTRVIVGGAPGSRAGRAASIDTGPGGAAQGAMQAQQGAGMTRAGEGGGGVAEADVTLLSPSELFFLGRHPGSMNVILQANDGRCIVKDLVVTMDPGTLQAQLAELMPDETGVKVRAAESSIVLTGTVNDAVKLDQILTLAGSYADTRRVVNMLRVSAPQQVMLEVKIAEVSKTLLNRFGLDFSRVLRDGTRFGVFSGLFGGQPLGLGSIHPRPNNQGEFQVPSTFPGADLINSANSSSKFVLNAEKQDGVIRVLAEPNIMAISGQAASFLSGGKIFIPVGQATQNGGTTITLEEKEFGVGLKFTPTVLDGRINLKFVSEVSELSQTGTPFTTVAGVTAVLPSLATRRVDTTVQLADGQSFAVAGLIRSNITEALNKFPGLGEAPVLGALFRSTEFQNDQTELLFVVTPRLVRPVIGPIPLPTDNHAVPKEGDVVLRGKGEAPEPAPVPTPPRPVGAPAVLAPTNPSPSRP